MTHSLHRSGDIDSQKKDFCWFMYQTQGVNDKNIKDKALEFIASAEAWRSENWGDVKTGPLTQFTSEQIREKISDKSRIRGVFTSKEQVVGFLKDIKKKDLGMSSVITGVLSEVLPACKEAGVTPHSINYSLGVWGKKDKLPDDDTLSVTTMCGHHMVPPKFVADVQAQVDAGKITAEDGAKRLSTFCYCGIFNPIRCAEILAIVSEKNKKAKE
ncbi:hypothetical protein AGMMS50276_20370 [Synergistales bacterium]|nr:hypothetical protein AGMMS50276_20370 [Synergistales bacterium]